MTHTLEIPDAVYSALVQAAKSSGTTPLDWIVARLPIPGQALNPARAPTEADGQPPMEDVDELADARPWRGVYAPAIPRPVLFTQIMEIHTQDLRQWKPPVDGSRRSMEPDDE